jgi:superfamily II DNA helicase RecQ
VLLYQPSQGEQQLWLLEERHSHPDWDMKPLQELKRRRGLALQEMQRYGSWSSCRAQYWNGYFQSSTSSMMNCGVCDNCLTASSESTWNLFCNLLKKGVKSRMDLVRKMPQAHPEQLEFWIKSGLEEGWLMETQQQGLFLAQGRTAPEQAP